MPSVPDTANLPPWLIPKREPWEALVAGVQAGSAIASNRLRAQQMIMESEQNYRREETATKLKMLDLGLEADRNDIALKTLEFKREADNFKSVGMLAVGGYVGNAVKNQKLLDPETQAGYWDTAGKYNVPHEVSNSIWDNTFGNAMRLDAQAKRITSGADTSAKLEQQGVIDKMEQEIASFEEESNALGWTPESKAELASKKLRLDRFRMSTGFVTPDESRQMRLAEFRADVSAEEAEKRRAQEKEMAGARTTSSKELQDQRFKRQAALIKTRAENTVINSKYNFKRLEATGDQAKIDKINAEQEKEVNALWDKYNATFDKDEGAASPAPTAAPSSTVPNRRFRYNPATGMAEEIK